MIYTYKYCDDESLWVGWVKLCLVRLQWQIIISVSYSDPSMAASSTPSSFRSHSWPLHANRHYRATDLTTALNRHLVVKANELWLKQTYLACRTQLHVCTEWVIFLFQSFSFCQSSRQRAAGLSYITQNQNKISCFCLDSSIRAFPALALRYSVYLLGPSNHLHPHQDTVKAWQIGPIPPFLQWK